MKKTDYIIYNGRRELSRRLIVTGALSRDDLGDLTIQTVQPWKRLLGALFGAGLLLFGIWLFTAEFSHWIACLFLLVGLFVVIASLLGRKKTLDSILQGMDGAASDTIIDMIIRGIL